MDKVTDAERQQMLGQGLAAQAAMIKRLRQQQLDRQIEQMSGMAPAMPAQPAPMPAQGMSQADFSGYGQRPPPNQAQLIELLRRRQMAMPQAQQ